MTLAELERLLDVHHVVNFTCRRANGYWNVLAHTSDDGSVASMGSKTIEDGITVVTGRILERTSSRKVGA